MRRSLAEPLTELAFGEHKIALVSGPRQCGKTTLGGMLLEGRGCGAYHNWDDVRFRRTWTKDPSSIAAAVASEDRVTPLLVLDEIHKARGWKRTLKGMFDTLTTPCDIMVTGSARLNVYKKGGDSLLGRALHFRLHPLSVAEIERPRLPREPDTRLDALFTRAIGGRRRDDLLPPLLRYGGFPEPFLAASDRKARVWRHNRVEKVIREDLRDLSRIPELGRVEMLASLLPERVGSLLSRASLREDLEVSFDSVTRWLALLSELYYAFELKPFARSVARSLKKEGKLYLWDWSEVSEPGARFENLVACHLLKACDYWTDTGEGAFALAYMRNKEKEEIDFLVLRDGKPWLPVEAKLTDDTPSRHWRKFLGYLKCPRALQLVATPKVFRKHPVERAELLVASAGEALAYWQ
jgi:uncharacterized protein